MIRDAIDSTFFNDGCGHDPNVRITNDMLKEIDRKLFVAVRHVVSVLGEIGDVLVDPFEHDIRRALGIIICKEYQYR